MRHVLFNPMLDIRKLRLGKEKREAPRGPVRKWQGLLVDLGSVCQAVTSGWTSYEFWLFPKCFKLRQQARKKVATREECLPCSHRRDHSRLSLWELQHARRAEKRFQTQQEGRERTHALPTRSVLMQNDKRRASQNLRKLGRKQSPGKTQNNTETLCYLLEKEQSSKSICNKLLTEYMEQYLLLSTSLSERTDYWNVPDPPQVSLLLSTEIWFPVLTVYPPRPNPVRNKKKESSSNGLMLKKKWLILLPYVELSPRYLKPQHREAEQLTFFIKRAVTYFPSLLESSFYHHQPSEKALVLRLAVSCHCQAHGPFIGFLLLAPFTSLVLIPSSSLSLHHEFIPFLLAWCFNSLGP